MNVVVRETKNSKTYRSLLGCVAGVALVAGMFSPIAVFADDSTPEVPPALTQVVEIPTQELPAVTETSAPAPTEVPATEAPTEVSETATVVPTETEEPATETASATPDTSGDTPTATPTETSAGLPTVTETTTATATPAPFEPKLECNPIPGAASVAGESEWGLLDCTLTWATLPVRLIHVRNQTSVHDWELIIADPDDLQDSSGFATRTGEFDLTDKTPGDDSFETARFLVGTRLGCTAALSATIDLGFQATIAGENGDTKTGEFVRQLVINGQRAWAPAVHLSSVSFDPIADSLAGTRSTTGSLTFTFDNASESCGWEASFDFSDFVSGGQSIPSANLNPIQIVDTPGLTLAGGAGSFSMVAAPNTYGNATSGTVTVQLALDLGGFVPAGDYQATVTMSSGAYGATN